MIRTEQDFGRACQSRGYARLATRFYARCIGDGIYQTIYTGFKKYIDTDAPNYSSAHRKSNYISIDLWSVYSYHNEDVFMPGKISGGYRPADLCNKGKHSGPFHGIEKDYEYMEQAGFDVLDDINTQEKFLEWWELVQVNDTGYRIHDTKLVEPFLVCGKMQEAEYEISVGFIQDVSAYIGCKKRIESGIQERYLPYEERIQQSAEREMILWHWCMGRQYKEFQSYIHENYQRNMAWVHKYGIPSFVFAQPRMLEYI